MLISRARGEARVRGSNPRLKLRRVASPRTHRTRAGRAPGDGTRRVEGSTARARVPRVGARRTST